MLTMLPSQVIFAKIIPENVESAMFALLTGLVNFANLFASKELAILINHFVGVVYTPEYNNLEMIWKLYSV
jgi:BT1 family